MDGPVIETKLDDQTPPALPDVNGISGNTLQALADSLGMDVHVGVNRMLNCHGVFRFAAEALGLKGKIDASIVSDFVSANGEDAGVLLKVMGDLVFFVFASDFDKRVHLLVLNGEKMKNGPASHLESLGVRSWTSALKYLTPATVRVYSRDFNEETWTRQTGESKTK